MAQPNSALTPPGAASSEALAETLTETLNERAVSSSAEEAAWRDVLLLLRRAAKLAAERGAETDLFMQAAWAACLDARPGLRQELADKELRSQLKKLRKRGLVASA